MHNKLTKLLVTTAMAFTVLATAQAHIGYGGRDFGTFQADGTEAPKPITGQVVSSSFGWASATTDNFGDSHRTRAFRFTLANAGIVTLQVQALNGLLPAFSIYSGLAHIGSSVPFYVQADHDSSTSSLAYLDSLGGVPKEGALVALGDWKIGNEDETRNATVVPASLSSLTYMGHAADGTSTNYGTASGINGDGAADGFVTGTFSLQAGTYSIFIGGANLGNQVAETAAFSGTPSTPYVNYGITPTLTVVPEPSTYALVLAAGGIAWTLRRKKLSH